MKSRPRQPDLFDTANTFALALVTIPDPATAHADRLATQARAADLKRRTQNLPDLDAPLYVIYQDGRDIITEQISGRTLSEREWLEDCAQTLNRLTSHPTSHV